MAIQNRFWLYFHHKEKNTSCFYFSSNKRLWKIVVFWLSTLSRVPYSDWSLLNIIIVWKKNEEAIHIFLNFLYHFHNKLFIILLMIFTINITFPVFKNVTYEFLCKKIGIMWSNSRVVWPWVFCDWAMIVLLSIPCLCEYLEG